MTVIELCAFLFSAAGTLKTLIVRKLTAIVHGDAFECVIEVFSISAFQFVQSLYHAAACVVRQEDEDAVTAQPFGKDKERLGGPSPNFQKWCA